MNYILDTHIVCWANLEAERLTSTIQKILEQEDSSNTLYISDITLWEIAMLISRRRLIVTMPIQHWIDQCVSNLKLEVISLTPEIVADSVQLPNNFHSDPADQLIVSTARCISATLITHDQKILEWAKPGFVHTLAA